jgi:hypothetical protein
MIFNTKHTLRSSLVKTRLERDPQQKAQCVYRIPCERGRSYIGDTNRPLAVRLPEHTHNLKEEGCRVDLDEARILESESIIRQRKYKELAHMSCLTNPISQPSLDIFPIWILLISNEVTNSQRK